MIGRIALLATVALTVVSDGHAQRTRTFGPSGNWRCSIDGATTPAIVGVSIDSERTAALRASNPAVPMMAVKLYDPAGLYGRPAGPATMRYSRPVPGAIGTVKIAHSPRRSLLVQTYPSSGAEAPRIRLTIVNGAKTTLGSCTRGGALVDVEPAQIQSIEGSLE